PPTLRVMSWIVLVYGSAGFSWMSMSQIVKTQTKALREREFVLAARFSGVGTFSMLTRHIVPNVSSLLIVDATIGVCGAIIAATSPSYLGLSIQPPYVSLGTLLQHGNPSVVARTRPILIRAGFLIARTP